MDDSSNITLEINSLGGSPVTLNVSSIQCPNYGIATDYCFVFAVATNTYLNISQLLGMPARLSIKESDTPEQFYHGIISKIVGRGKRDEEGSYEIQLNSILYRLKLTKHNRVFTNKSVLEIIHLILSTVNMQIKTQIDYPKLAFVVQNNETDYDFFQRLLVSFNLFYVFKQLAESSLCIITDNWQEFTEKVRLLPYQWPSGQVMQDSYVYNFNETATWQSNSLLLSDCYPDEAQEIVINKGSESKLVPAYGQQHHHGCLYQDDKAVPFFTQSLLAQLELQRNFFMAETSDKMLCPGQVISLSDHPDEHYNRSYRIINMAIDWGNEKTHIPWRITLTLIHSEKVFLKSVPAQPCLAGVTLAQVENIAADIPQSLDDYGRHRLRFAFDTADTPIGQASKAIMRSQFYGGSSSNSINDIYGIHYPLQSGIEVAVACLFDDWQRPVILGALPSHVNLSPVTAVNSNQHCFTTQLGHTLSFNDKQQQEAITIATHDQQNSLFLTGESASLQSSSGNLIFQAAQNIVLTSGKTCLLQTNGDQHTTVNNDQHITILHGNQTWQSGRAFLAKANHNFQLQSEQSDIVIDASKQMTMAAFGGISHLIQTGSYQVNIEHGKLHFYAQGMQINTVDAPGTIFIGRKNSFIEHNQHALSMLGQNIIIEAPIIEVS